MDEHLRTMTIVCAEIQAIRDADLSPEEMADLRDSIRDAFPIEGEFPGNRDRAMGHALALVESLDDVGISAEREYVGLVEWSNKIHRINISLTGDGSGECTERGGA